MFSDSGEEREDERLNECLVKFENMLSNDDQYYFDVSDLEELIDHYLERMHLEKAWKVLELASQQHPHSSEFELKRAEILSLKGDFEQAMLSIKLLESIMPNSHELLMTKAGILSEKGDHLQSIAIYDQAISTAEIKSEV
ncbi:MAG: DUF3808 domain-containing protein [Flavobacteriales bacterium]|nr:DUF3808 domain-containing protein [Flavobacteriales bacterium]